MILRQSPSGPITVGSAIGDFLRWNGVEWVPAPGSSVVAPFQTDVFAGPGPAFVLSALPVEPANIVFRVNGASYRQTPGVWTLAGVTATWANVLFTLDAGDEVILYYEV